LIVSVATTLEAVVTVSENLSDLPEAITVPVSAPPPSSEATDEVSTSVTPAMVLPLGLKTPQVVVAVSPETIVLPNAAVTLSAIAEPAGNGASTVPKSVALVFVTVVVTAVVVVVAEAGGATDRIPRPNAATDTSAMRLNVDFVDMCFLSIVDPRTVRSSA